jgi:hypothetical protein
MEDVLQYVSAEIIYCRERARQALEKAEAAATAETKGEYLAAEARWLALARSHDAQQRLSRMLSDSAGKCPDFNIKGRVFDAEVVAIISTALHHDQVIRCHAEDCAGDRGRDSRLLEAIVRERRKGNARHFGFHVAR